MGIARHRDMAYIHAQYKYACSLLHNGENNLSRALALAQVQYMIRALTVECAMKIEPSLCLSVGRNFVLFSLL